MATVQAPVRRRNPERRGSRLLSSRWRWHLDEVSVQISGERHSPWRAVDHKGDVLESFATKTRDKKTGQADMRLSNVAPELLRQGGNDVFDHARHQLLTRVHPRFAKNRRQVGLHSGL